MLVLHECSADTVIVYLFHGGGEAITLAAGGAIKQSATRNWQAPYRLDRKDVTRGEHAL